MIMRPATRHAALVLAAIAAAPAAHAQSLWPLTAPLPPRVAPSLPPVMQQPTPGLRCRQAIRLAEQTAGIPDQLMAAIGRVESGRREADGSVNPWPWSINAEGTDHIYESKAEAVAAVRALQQQGVRSIDVGCMQVNLLHHPDAFASLEDAFDPAINAAYAARFLVQLHGQTGSWPTATAWYHSATPDLGADYERKVMAVLPDERMRPRDRLPQAPSWSIARPVAAMPVASAARPAAARIIPMAAGAAGRSLSAYRSAPIPLAAPVIDARSLDAAPVPPPRGVSSPG